MPLPVRLAPGLVSIYGTSSINGITFPVGSKFQFGVVDAVYDEFGNYSIGQNVLFNLDAAQRVDYDNIQYFLLPEANIKFIEDSILPP